MNYMHKIKFKYQFLGIALACALCSCSTITVLQHSPTNDCGSSGQKFCYDTTLTRSLWKGNKNKQEITSKCVHGISRVKVTTKPGDVLLGFFTLGFVVKQRLEWDCQQRSGESDFPK